MDWIGLASRVAIDLLVALAVSALLARWAMIRELYAGPNLATFALVVFVVALFGVNQFHVVRERYFQHVPTAREMRAELRDWLDNAGYTLGPDDPDGALDFRFVATKGDRGYTIMKRANSNQLIVGMGISVGDEHREAIARLSKDDAEYVSLRLSSSLGQLDLDFEIVRQSESPNTIDRIAIQDGQLVLDDSLTPQLLLQRLSAIARGHVVVSTSIGLALREISRQ